MSSPFTSTPTRHSSATVSAPSTTALNGVRPMLMWYSPLGSQMYILPSSSVTTPLSEYPLKSPITAPMSKFGLPVGTVTQ